MLRSMAVAALSLAAGEALAQETSFLLHSSLSGSFAVMTEGSCERGAPYAGFGGTGSITAGTPEPIAIAADALPDGPRSFNLRFCVTEVGGGTNSVLYGLAIDNDAPSLTVDDGGPVCLPSTFSVLCTDCAGVAETCETGDELEVDFRNGLFVNHTRNIRREYPPVNILDRSKASHVLIRALQRTMYRIVGRK